MTVPHPILRYHGGKWKIAPWLMGYFPPHHTYVEVFGGGAGVLLRKRPSAVEVFNDLDDDVTNFFSVLRERPADLARAIAFTPYARTEMETAWQPADDPLERARRFLVRSWMSIGGPSTRWRSGFRYRRKKARSLLNRWNDLPAIILAVAERLKEVVIENADYPLVLRRYDGPETLFYCDPPYLGETRSQWGRFRAAYRHEFTDDDHIALAEALHALQGMVVLSGYAHPLYEALYERRGWERHDLPTVNQNGTRVTESIWLNPAAQARLRVRQLSLFHKE